VFEDTRSIVEPSGALAVAGIKKYCSLNNWQDKRVVAINSGANMNFDQLRYVAERSDVGQAREALLAVEIPEQPGSFLTFCELLGQRAVTEFNYRFGTRERAQIFVGFALSRGPDKPRVAFVNLVPAEESELELAGEEIKLSDYADTLFESIEPVPIDCEGRTAEQCEEEALEKVLALLAEERASVSSVRRGPKAWDIHVLDSLSGLVIPELANASRMADVGSGSGFPGLTLAAALPDARLLHEFGAAMQQVEAARAQLANDEQWWQQWRERCAELKVIKLATIAAGSLDSQVGS
jgi:hypothetical protein